LKNSLLCRLFCVFLNGSSVYNDCMLAVLQDEAVKEFLIHLVLLCTNCLFLKLSCYVTLYCVYTCGLSLCLSYCLLWTNKRVHKDLYLGFILPDVPDKMPPVDMPRLGSLKFLSR